jgi:hypothetical protein
MVAADAKGTIVVEGVVVGDLWQRDAGMLTEWCEGANCPGISSRVR